MSITLKERVERSPYKKGALAKILGIESWQMSRYLGGHPMPFEQRTKLEEILTLAENAGFMRAADEDPTDVGGRWMLKWEAVKFTQLNPVIWRSPGGAWRTGPLPWDLPEGLIEYEWDSTMAGGEAPKRFLRRYL